MDSETRQESIPGIWISGVGRTKIQTNHIHFLFHPFQQVLIIRCARVCVCVCVSHVCLGESVFVCWACPCRFSDSVDYVGGWIYFPADIIHLGSKHMQALTHTHTHKYTLLSSSSSSDHLFQQQIYFCHAFFYYQQHLNTNTSLNKLKLLLNSYFGTMFLK